MTDEIRDGRGNRATLAAWGGENGARAALASLEDCSDCLDCADCVGCRRCRYCVSCRNCVDCAGCIACHDQVQRTLETPHRGDAMGIQERDATGGRRTEGVRSAAASLPTIQGFAALWSAIARDIAMFGWRMAKLLR